MIGDRRKTAALVIFIGVAFCSIILGLSAGVTWSTRGMIAASADSPEDVFTAEEIEGFRMLEADCIMVMGAAVQRDGTPSPMLRERLDAGIALYRAGAAPKLLLTGDSSREGYDETGPMKNYALEAGVPEEDILLDRFGISTYDSVFRARSVFGAEAVIAVTQTYHLYRTLYGCRAMGIRALGAGSDQAGHPGAGAREVREVLARDKDAVKWVIGPEPAHTGEER